MTTLALNAQVLAPTTPISPTPTPMVVLHGLFGSGANWRTLARRWSSARTVHLLDARNHGDSPHDPSMSYEAQAADLASYLAHHVSDPPVVLGHSMGGKTAMHFALNAQAGSEGSIRGLIVVDIAPIEYEDTESHLPLIDAMLALDLSQCRSRTDADARLRETVADAGLRAFLLHNLTRAGGGLRWRINLPAIRSALAQLRGFSGATQRYEGPTLVLRGAQSQYIPAAAPSVFTTYFPNAHTHTIENAGHWVHAEQPEAVFDEVSAFLEDLETHR